MAKEICAVTADQIQHRDQTIVAALPQVVPFSAFVDRIQTDGLQQWDQSGSAEMLIPFYIVRCRIEGPLGRAQWGSRRGRRASRVKQRGRVAVFGQKRGKRFEVDFRNSLHIRIFFACRTASVLWIRVSALENLAIATRYGAHIVQRCLFASFWRIEPVADPSIGLKYKFPMSRIAAAYGASALLFCYRRSDRQLPDTAANLGAQAQPDIVVSRVRD